jgi:PPM family protein phosphatase
MLTVAHRVENGGRGEDRLLVEHCGSRTLAVVADGAGGTGGGAAVVVEISEGRIIGASVGDSGAWMLTGKAIIDLSENQHRKPLLGSDEAMPMGFGPIELSGRLLIATDGLFKYATESDVAKHAIGVSVNDAVARLIAGVRLRSGALQDDVGIILIEDAVSSSTGNTSRSANLNK